MTDEYLSVGEAAKEMEVSRATMWKWVKRHELATFRFMGDRKTFLRYELISEKNKRPI
jgi:excisionase family DNA binding protein